MLPSTYTFTFKPTRSVSENSSLVLLNSLEKERKGVRIIRNHGENLPILPSRTRFTFTS